MSDIATLSVSGLCIEANAGAQSRRLVDGLEFQAFAGKTLCIVGESGSGKSLTSLSIMGLLPADSLVRTAGSIKVEGEELTKLSNSELRRLRATQISMIFQEPMTALNPIMRVGNQIDEVIKMNRRGIDRKKRYDLIIDSLDEVNLPAPEHIYRSYPHELSGGQRQRIMIAMALILNPKLLIADEPTTALDVTTQHRILDLMRNLQKKHNTAILFITHDFGVVYEMADSILVMRNGQGIEYGSRDEILMSPKNNYTKKLIQSVPSLMPIDRAVHDSRNEILRVSGLSKIFGRKTFFGKGRIVQALNGIDLNLHSNEILSIVGESGSGKSTLARCIVGLTSSWTGNIQMGGNELVDDVRRRPRNVKKRMQIVFQDPYRSLNPRRTIRDSLMEGPRNFGLAIKEVEKNLIDILDFVGIKKNALNRYPHQFSGGQRQRLCLARAIIMEPDILVADEATSALDVTVQKYVLDLLLSLKRSTNMSIILITHDLRVAAQIADRIIVMRNGEVVEDGSASDVMERPENEYTRELIDSAPGSNWDFRNFKPLNINRKRKKQSINWNL